MTKWTVTWKRGDGKVVLGGDGDDEGGEGDVDDEGAEGDGGRVVNRIEQSATRNNSTGHAGSGKPRDQPPVVRSQIPKAR